MFASLKPFAIGVPQESILRHLFNIIYVNDFHHSVTCTPRLYADDTCFVFRSKTIEDLRSLFDIELHNVSNWIATNQLALKNHRFNQFFKRFILLFSSILKLFSVM